MKKNGTYHDEIRARVGSVDANDMHVLLLALAYEAAQRSDDIASNAFAAAARCLRGMK